MATKHTDYTISVNVPTGKGDVIFELGLLKIPHGLGPEHIQEYGTAFIDGIFSKDFLKVIDEKGSIKIRRVK